MLFFVGLLLISSAGCSGLIAWPDASVESEKYLRASPEDMEWWRDAKFGMFVHWGPASLTGKEISWSRGGNRRSQHNFGSRDVPAEVYDNLYKKWIPEKFDAYEWIQLAKDAGAKYFVFVSKHHDGFCLFDSKLTEYTSSGPEAAWKHDAVADIVDACHKAGMKCMFYYSPVDWYHPDYRTENHQRYIEYFHGQMRELLTNYGCIDGIWFDGLGGSEEDWDSRKLFKMMRQLQPHLLINDRGGLPADFDTPEQRIGDFKFGRPWESCITICNQWCWKPNDTIKSLVECIQTLVKCNTRDGNLLLNIDPMPDGALESGRAGRFREIGDWLKKYGRSIYATRGGPFRLSIWGGSTHKDNFVYLHILDWRFSDGVIRLPVIEKKITNCSVLTGGVALVNHTLNGTEISVPASDRNDIDTIVVLELDGHAAEVKPVNVVSGSVAKGKKVTASSFRKQDPSFSPERAVDDDDTTCWKTDEEVKEAWLEVDLGKPTTFDRAMIWDGEGGVHKFELQYKDGDDFKTIVQGKRIGEKFLKFEPVTARFVRLNNIRSSRRISIWEFQLFAPSK
jgi:alpha-L-fucosidase